MSTAMDSIKTPTISANLHAAKMLGITGRQLEASSWAANGKTDDEIGAIMECTPRTAKAHVQDAMKRTDTHTRAQLVAKLFIEHVFSAAVSLCLIFCIAGGLVDGNADEMLRARTRTTTSARIVRMARGNKDAA